MPKRSSRDVNQLAASILAKAIADLPPQEGGKNPAAVALGRIGGLKGGKARAQALSATKRSRIAKRAARARWGDKSRKR